jgi:hypothetical protein
MRTGRDEWTKRVERWKDSGLTAKESSMIDSKPANDDRPLACHLNFGRRILAAGTAASARIVAAQTDRIH